MLDLGTSRAAVLDPPVRGPSSPGRRAVDSGFMESRLRAAVRDGGLALHYQPVVDLSNGATTGVEALARWTDDELGVVPPDVFIPLAETTDLIVELGRWVLTHACTQAVSWTRRRGLAAHHVGQRLPRAAARAVLRGRRAPGARRERSGPRASRARGHRDGDRHRRRRRCRHPAQGPRPRGAVRARRLRHRPLVADAAAQPAAPVGQDRPLADQQGRHRGAGRRAGPARRRRRPHPRPAGLRGGRRGGRPGPAAGVPGLRRRTGLAVRSPEPSGHRPRPDDRRGPHLAGADRHAAGRAVRERGPRRGHRPAPLGHLRLRLLPADPRPDAVGGGGPPAGRPARRRSRRGPGDPAGPAPRRRGPLAARRGPAAVRRHAATCARSCRC